MKKLFWKCTLFVISASACMTFAIAQHLPVDAKQVLGAVQGNKNTKWQVSPVFEKDPIAKQSHRNRVLFKNRVLRTVREYWRPAVVTGALLAGGYLWYCY